MDITAVDRQMEVSGHYGRGQTDGGEWTLGPWIDRWR